MAGIAPEDDDGNAAAAAAPSPRHAARQEPAQTQTILHPVEGACNRLRAATTEVELQAAWKALSPDMQRLDEVFAAKEDSKSKIKAAMAMANPYEGAK
jgi:hypothetical protein